MTDGAKNEEIGSDDRPAVPIDDQPSLDKVTEFIEKTDIGEPPELSLEEQLEQLKGTNATLRVQIEIQDRDLSDLRDELSSERDYATKMQRSYHQVEEDRNREKDEFKNALELVALFFAGDTSPVKAVIQLELLAATTEPPMDMTRLRPIITRALSSAYERSVQASMKAAEGLQKKVEEETRKQSEGRIGSMLDKIFGDLSGEECAPSEDIFGGDASEERHGCGEPDCPSCSPGGFLDRMGL